MSRRYIIVCALFIYSMCFALSQEEEAAALWFPVGEELVYKVYWGFIPVAKSRATSEWVEENGKRYLAIRFRTKSNGYLNKIYPVDDFIESIIDPENFTPIRFTKKLNEGRYSCHEVTTFDHEQLTARWESKRKKKKNKVKEYQIEKNTRDIIAFMYYMRAAGLQEGDKKTFKVMADEKIYDLEVKASRKDRVKLKKYGKVKSLRLEPKAAFQGIFVRKGKMTLWVSEDDRRICTKIVADTPFANVKIILSKVNGPGNDRWVDSDVVEYTKRGK